MRCPQCGRQFAASVARCPDDGAQLTPSGPVEFFEPKPTSEMGMVINDRYRIEGFIGAGSMGRVYLVEDLQGGQYAALKVLSAGPNQAPDLRERFLREAKAAMSIEHPNVVKILAVGEREDGAPYIVMEALVGESLRSYLRRDGAMPTDLALTVMRQAAAGLAAAHKVGVFHRDVKPDNLFLLGPPGEPFGLKILDFGLAKIGWRPPSRPGLAIGTIEYMAPEQIVGEAADARTDVYGLGVVMFRVFTSHLPFEVRADADLLAHQLISPAPPPTWLSETLDPRIEAIILTAMRKRPENRYGGMMELMADIDRVIGVRAGKRTGHPMRRKPDVYEPSTPFGYTVAKALYAQLGVAVPFGPPSAPGSRP